MKAALVGSAAVGAALHRAYSRAARSESETDAELSLQFTRQAGLGADDSKIGVVDIEARVIGLGMIENIRCVHTDLHTRGFANPE